MKSISLLLVSDEPVAEKDEISGESHQEENSFDNDLSQFSSVVNSSEASLTALYHDNVISDNRLVNGSLSHPESLFDPIHSKSGSGSLEAVLMWSVILLSCLFNLR